MMLKGRLPEAQPSSEFPEQSNFLRGPTLALTTREYMTMRVKAIMTPIEWSCIRISFRITASLLLL